jgi:hypothetical protein
MDNNDSNNKPWAYGESTYQEVDSNQALGDKKNKIKWSSSSDINIGRHKGWYLGLVFVFAIVSIVFYLISKDLVAAVVILLSGILIYYYGIKRPREINYSIDENSIDINNRKYNLSSYKYFYVNEREHGGSASLVPLKRFSPSLDLFYDIADEDKILEILSNSLPLKQKETDLFDSMMRFIGF